MSDGEDKLNALRAGGFSETEIAAYQADRSKALLDGGFSQEDVAKYWGQKEFNTAPVKQYFEKNLAAVKDQPNLSFGDYVNAGWQTSITGLIKRQKMPDTILPSDVPMWGSIAAKVTQMAGDLPAMAAGSWIGGAFGEALGGAAGGTVGSAIPGAGTAVGTEVGGAAGAVMGAGYGTMALPAYLRRVMVDAYTKGEILDFKDFWSRTAAAFIDAHHAGEVGALTAGVGGVVGQTVAPIMSPIAAKAANLSSQVATMTIAGKAMEGEVPTLRDFVEGAILVGGMSAAGAGADLISKQITRVSRKLGENYAQTGIRPDEVAKDATTNPTVKQDILSDNIQVPRKYEGVIDPAGLPEKSPVAVAVNEILHKKVDALKDFDSQPSGLAIQQDVSRSTSPVNAVTGQPFVSEAFHGTTANFEKFDVSKLGSSTLAKSAQKAFFLTKDPELASTYAANQHNISTELQYLRDELGAANEAVALDPGSMANKDWLAHVQKKISTMIGRPVESLDDAFDAKGFPTGANVRRQFVQMENPLVVDFKGGPRTRNFSQIIDSAKELGHDGVVFKNVFDSPGQQKAPTDVYAVFKDTQILDKPPAGGGAGEPPKPPGLPPSSEGIPSPRDQVLARISMEEMAKSKGITLDKMYTALVDDLHPVKQLTRLLNGEKPLEVKDDPYLLARLTRGSTGKADHFLEYSPFEYGTLKNVGEPLTKILEPVRGDLDGLRAYAVSKRALELNARGIETGVPIDAAQEVVGSTASKFDATFQQLKAYQTRTLAYLKDSGILSEESFAKMQDANQDYVPFYRLMQEGEAVKGGAGKGLSVRSPVKGITGSERQIVDPLESIIKNTYLYVQLAERNRALVALANLAESAGDAGAQMMERVPAPQRPITVTSPEVARFMKENGIEGEADAMTIFRPRQQALAPDEIALYRDGAREVYRVDPSVANAVRSLDRESVNLAIKIMAAPAKALRAGTTLSPEFVVRNFVRDQNTAFILNEKGYIPIFDALRGMGSIFKKDADYQNWLKSGGASSAVVSMDRDYIEQNVFKLEGETGLMSKTWNVVKSPLEMMRITSELIENASRIGAYKRAAEGETDLNTIMEAGMSSRDVTLDFQRIGSKMRAANMITAFLNPGVQGLARTAESFRDRPGSSSFKAAVAITAPSVLLWYANHEDPRWQEVPRWQKDLFWIMFTQDHIYRIPKPPVLGQLFGSVPERVLDMYVDQNPKAFKDLSGTMLQAVAPNYIPTFALPVIEQFANRSTFTGNPIVPSSMEGILPEYQYTDYTTEAGKLLGKFVATVPGMRDSSLSSPAVIENYVRAWSGSLGMYALKAADEALIKTGTVPDPVKPAATLADIPVVKAFVIRYPSSGAQSIQDFYDSYDKTQTRINTIKYLAKAGDAQAALDVMKLAQNENDLVVLTGVKDALSTQNKFLRLTAKNPQLMPDEKRQIIDGVYYGMIASAKLGNQMIDGMNRDIDSRKLAIQMPPSTTPKPETPPVFGGGPVIH